MIRVVLADDHEMVRAGFRMVLERDRGIQVVGEASEGMQAYAVVARERPNVLLLDISMPPGQSGLVACGKITADFPETKVLVVTMFIEPEYLQFTLRSGAAGYLLKNATADELLDAVRTVAAGKRYVHPKMDEVMRRYIEDVSEEPDSGIQKITARELEILQLLARGFTNKEISDRVFVSVKTVEAHRAKIYSKLNLSSRAELVEFAIEHKLFNI